MNTSLAIARELAMIQCFAGWLSKRRIFTVLANIIHQVADPVMNSNPVSKHQLSWCENMHLGTFCKLDTVRLLLSPQVCDEVMANQNNIGTEEIILYGLE